MMSEHKQSEFEKVYKELAPKMRNFAGRLCRNKDEADDVTQDAFIKAYKSFETCDDSRQIDNWLMRIVYNTYLDRKRMKSRRIQESGNSLGIPDSTVDDFADISASPEEIVLSTIASPELLSALATLDADSRELMRLIYVEQRDQKDLSEEYGIQIGTLRSRIHRITVKLRNELTKGTTSAPKNSLA
jgi:RNA polymerase sigma-70 factor (ECF subfamily)